MEVEVKRGGSLVEGQLPTGWARKPCSKTGDTIAGKALNSKGAGTLQPYLRTINVLDGSIDLEDVLEMPFTGSEFEKYRLQYGDVLLNEGQTLELVGRCSMYRDEYPGECGIQNQLLRFRPYCDVYAPYAEQLFRYCQQTDVFEGIATQTTSVAHIGLNRFRKLELPWPSNYDEQRAIAEALSDVDALIERLDTLIAKKRAVKTATMQRLLTGQQRLPGFDGAWETRRLGEISSVVAGQSPLSRYYNSHGEGLPLIQGNADIENRKSIERVWTTSSPKTCMVGDLLLTVRAPVGHVAVASQRSCLGRGVCSLTDIEIDLDFLFQKLIHCEPDWESVQQGSTFTSASTKQVANFSIRVPSSIPEQQAIATVLSDMDAEIEALEARRDKTQNIKQGMMQELLTGRTRLV